MASNINYVIIDENYPTPGIDNPSQQFRDNYAAIKNAFRVTKTEIETLQLTTAKIDASNNFSGNRIIDADFTGVTGKVFIGQDPLTTSQNIDWNNGHFQLFQLGKNITYTLKNWPTAGRFGSVRVALIGDGVDYRRAEFVVEGSGTIFYDKAYPQILSVFFTNKAKIIEFSSYSGSNTIYAKYLGEYDTTRYGAGGGGSDISDISQLTDENDLLFSKSYKDLTDVPNFANVATSGSYADLLNKPNFANVATSGSYGDLSNKPVIPTDLSQLTNTGAHPYINNLSLYDTDDLPQGVNNLYLNQSNFNSFFASANEQAISNIPNDTLTDSVETTATPVISIGTTITLTNSSLINSFKAGQHVIVYGANISTDDTAITDLPTLQPITKNGFITVPATPSLFSYKIAQFKFETGKISPASFNADVTNVDISIFNTTNNLTLNISRTNTTYGVLVYRKITGAVNSGDYQLVSVLGSKELGTNLTVTWTDFYDYDSTSWSGKSLTRNEYQSTTGLVHFPLTAPAEASRGWVAAQITTVTVESSRLVLNTTCAFNTTITISHDDTYAIQTAIDSRSANNLNSLKLGDKKYIVGTLSLPSNFTIIGGSKQSMLRRLSWGSYPYATNKIFRSLNNSTRIAVSIESVSIDGNMQNSYLYDDSTDYYANYAIDIRGTNNTFKSISMSNIPAGGIASPDAENLTIDLCQIQNSGMSDRYSYSPVAVSSGYQILVTNNIMRNFSDAADASVCNIAVLTGNIINNCGSGLLVYGSTKLISSPNLILGPAEEFIQGPDIFNSEYDSVNITLEPNANFISDVYVYQENGATFDISSTHNRSYITYRVDKLRKLDNVEELFGEVTTGSPAGSPIAAVYDPDEALAKQGQFRFQISQANVNILKTTYSYAAMSQAYAGYQGLVYRALLTEYVPSGAVTKINGGYTPTVTTVSGIIYYTVKITPSTVNVISVGNVVKFLGHTVTPSLDNIRGTITNINATTNVYTIAYAVADVPGGAITEVGYDGQITIENTFALAKGRIL